jgi:hypothetical protein
MAILGAVKSIWVMLAIPYLVSSVMLIWGWARWARRAERRTVFSILSLAGFVLATASALLAASSIAYAQMIHGFSFYDPLLMRIYGWGVLLSLGGILFGIGGVWRPSSLRWHAPISGVCMLACWIMATWYEF